MTTNHSRAARRPRKPLLLTAGTAAVALAVLATTALTSVPAAAKPRVDPGRRPEVPGVTVSPTRDVRGVASSVERQAARMPAARVVSPQPVQGRGRTVLALARGSRAGLARAGSLPLLIGDTAGPAGRPLSRGGRIAAITSSALASVEAVALPAPSTARLGAAAAFRLSPEQRPGASSARRPKALGPGDGVVVQVDLAQLARGRGADWAARARLVAYPACAAAISLVPSCLVGTPLMTTTDSARQTLTAVTSLNGSVVIAAAAGASGTSGDFTATPLASSGQWAAGGNSGAFSWAYPIETPAVAGGLGPDLSLSYSSSAVDGRATSTNNQPSWVGEGWDFSTGSIERQYKPCQDDMGSGSNNTKKSGDLCWVADNATLAFGSHSGELVRDGSSRQWRLRDDDGTRVELLTAPWDNGDNDREYWKVTTPDGTQYRFGLGRPHTSGVATRSTWTVPVAGNNAGEPCHGSTFSGSFCAQAWKWNLDSVVDVSGNSLTAFYQNESNRYGQNLNEKSVPYDRGGYLTRIEYGTRSGFEGQAKAPAQVVFTTAERCLPTSTEKCTSLAAKNNLAWPDVPQDQLCESTSSCANRTSPTFFTRKRLTQISTQILAGTAYTEVQRWNLAQSFPNPGDGTSAGLWMQSITRSAAGGTAPLPATVFAGIQMASRVDGVEDTLGKSADPFIKWRISGVSTESGLDLLVSYSAKDCTPTSLPTAETNTRRCYPVWFTPPGGVKPGRHWFHKYVVTRITEHDLTNSSPISTVHTYTYLGSPAWTYDDNPIVKAKYRTWSKWAGYGRVRVVTGNPSAASSLRTETLYYRGLDGDRAAPGGGTKDVTVVDSEGTAVADARRLAGMPREQITYNGVSGAEVVGSISDQTVLTTTATGQEHRAQLAATTRTHTRTALSSGSVRRTDLVTGYDDEGYPTQVDDHGDTGTATDDQCKRVSYARNAEDWVMTSVAGQQVRTGACSAWPSHPDQADVISDTRMSYDGLPLGQVSAGRLTKQEDAVRVDGDAIVYQTSSESTYDSIGRTVSVSDALGRVTRTAYVPSGAGLTVGTTLTSPDPDGEGPLTPHVASTTIDPRWGKPTKLVAAGGETTEATYDSYGRSTAVWEPGRSHAETPSKKFSYLTSKSAASAVTTQELTPYGAYTSSVELYDGLGRSKQTQTEQIGTTVTSSGAVQQTPGRTISDTVYDDRGLAVDARGPIFATGAPAAKLVAVADTAVPRMTSTTYDGAGRATVATLKALGKAKWSTTTSYGGDRTTVTPPAGGTATTTVTDARGRTSAVRQYLGATPSGDSVESHYVYDGKGQLTGFSDPVGNSWSYEYDLLGRQVRASDPDSGVTTKTYDAAGQLITSTDARRLTLAYSYDGLGRKLTLRDSDPAVGALQASWSYDTVKKGYLDSSARQFGDQQIVTRVDRRDAAGRPLQTSTVVPQIGGWVEAPLAKTYTTSQQYLVDGSPDTTYLPAMGPLPAEGLGYTYDPIGRPVAIGGNGAYVADTVYSGFGELLQWVGGMHEIDTTWATREYDEGTGRLVRNRFDRSGYPRADFDIRYSFSDGGTLTKIAASHPQSGAATDNQCFSYDGLQRLTRAWTPSDGDCAKAADAAVMGGPAPYSRAWAYDKASNRTSQTDFTGSKTVTSWQRPEPGSARPHAATSQTVTPVGGAPTTTQLSYDAAGNTVDRSGSTLAVFGAPATAQTMTYNAENRLEKIVQGVSTITYADDASGGKLLRRDNTTTTLYLGDTELILDRATGQVKANRYITYAGMTVAVDTGTGAHTTSTLWSDLNNTASWQVDNDGSKITERLSMPFGEIRGAAASLMGTHGFVGGTDDATANLVRVGARDYDPATGTFLSPDPIIDLNDPTQWNPYAYGNGNPLTRPDPSGLKPDPGTGGSNSSASGWIGNAFSAAANSLLPSVHSQSGSVHHSSSPTNSWVSSNGYVSASSTTGVVRVGGMQLPPQNHRGSTYALFRLADRVVTSVMNGAGTPSPTFAALEWKISQEYCKEYGTCGQPDQYVNALKFAMCSQESCSTDNHSAPVFKGRASTRALEHIDTLPCNCFPKGAVIATSQGKNPIENIRVGDRVWARDLKSGRLELRRVTGLFNKAAKKLVEINVSDGSRLSVTRQHPFFVLGTGWVAAGNLKNGDPLLSLQNLPVHVTKVRTVALRSKVFSFTVAGDHNYFVAKSQLLVHNCPQNAGGPQFASRTLGKGKGWRLDVENPNPAQRPGQMHLQDYRGNKYIYDHESGEFEGAPPKLMKSLNGDDTFQRGIVKGLRYLGITE